MWTKIKNTSKYFFVVSFFGLSILHFQFCTEFVNSPEKELFSFKVKVVDNTNKPLPNMKLGVYFHFTNQFFEKGITKVVNTNFGTTSIRYTVNTLCKISLTAKDLENRVARQLIDNDIHYAGNYEVKFTTGDLFPGVYKCILEAKDTLNKNTLFKDSIHAVLWHTDPIFNGIGFTDGNGTFETKNKIYFPSLYELPEFIRTLEESPEPLGTFRIVDSITILVTYSDNVLNWTQTYSRKLTKNTNSYELIFLGPAYDENLIEKRIGLVGENENRNKSSALFKPSEINSVGLEYFKASTVNKDAHLTWKTNWEINNSGFEIQRYSDYTGFNPIAFIIGHGNANGENTYTYIDENLTTGNFYYYRLKILEFGGSFEYSDTLEVSIVLPLQFTLYPNYPNPFN